METDTQTLVQQKPSTQAPTHLVEGSPKYDPQGAFAKSFKQGVEDVFGEKPAVEAPPKPAPQAPPPVKPPADKPTIAPPADNDELANPPEGISEKGKSSWQKMRARVTSLETEARTEKEKASAIEVERNNYRTELESLKLIGTKEEIDTLKKERAEFEKAVLQLNVELHPKFQSYFNGKFSTIEGDVKSVAGDQAQRIWEIIQQPESESKRAALIDAISPLDEIARSEIVQANANYRKVNQERSGEIAKSKENASKAAQDRQAMAEKQALEQKAVGEKVWTTHLAKFQDAEKGLPIFRKVEGDDAWNKQVDENIGMAKKLLLGQDNPPEVLAEAVFYAVHGRRAHGLLAAASRENAALRKQIADFTGADPKAPSGETKVAQGDPDGDPMNDTSVPLATRMANSIRSLGGKR